MPKNKFLDLMVLVEDQKWSVIDQTLIRNELGQCPICAIIDVLTNGQICYSTRVFTAWNAFLGNPPSPLVTPESQPIREIASASDNPKSPLRKKLETRLHVNK